jgi:hypothetical protein
MNIASSQKVNISGLDFDMTFTGTNKSASYYPFAGAITGLDAANGTGTYNTLNNDISITKCTFKLFHPYGAYVVTGRPYAGDPNNGYKLFSIFLSGDYTATNYANQNSNIKIQNCKTLDGHNGYGFWIWSYNNVEFISDVAENYVSKKSDTLGNVLGEGLPFLRYHQFNNSGLKVIGCDFHSRPSNLRTVAGFEGSSGFLDLNNNLQGNYSNGSAFIAHNNIITGRGDAVNSLPDNAIQIFQYGDIDITDNFFDEQPGSISNAYGGSYQILYSAQAYGSNGKGTLKITGNTFGVNTQYSSNIYIANGSNVSLQQRRLKSLLIANNFSYGQIQYFLNMESSATYNGVEVTTISNNLVDGTANTVFPSNNTNSRGMGIVTSGATDILRIDNLTVNNKYYAIYNSGINASAIYTITNPVFTGVTTSYVGAAPKSPNYRWCYRCCNFRNNRYRHNGSNGR